MGMLKLSTASGGSITLDPTNTASNFTVTIPAANAEMVSTAATQTLTNKTLTTPNIDSAQFATVSGTAPIYPCRAWVNFNGTGTVAIRASGNVSSITDNGTGDYTVNFTTAMPDANYSVAGAVSQETSQAGASVNISNATLPTTTAVRVLRLQGNVTSPNADSTYMMVSIFR